MRRAGPKREGEIAVGLFRAGWAGARMNFRQLIGSRRDSR
jgi:hypothetical protein